MSVSLVVKMKVDFAALDAVISRVGNQEDALTMAKDESVRIIQNNIEKKNVIDTGDLWRSISGEVRHNGFSVYDSVPYGIYNELGTYKMAARPFFVPAIEKFGEIYAASIRNHLA